MHPKRKKRLILIILMLVGIAIATAAILTALNQNLNLFFPPRDVVEGKAPEGATIRLGGVVKEGSVKRSQESLAVSFIITDYIGEVEVRFEGILPDLFAEGEAAVATGVYQDGIFEASQVLAKHDENYTPPEVEEAMQEHKRAVNYGS